MSELYGFDAFSPKEIARKVEGVGVTKVRLPFLQAALLGILAGAFIGLGSLYFTIVVSDATLGFALQRVLGGLVFSLGLLLVVVAGAELFTGNNLLAMAWAASEITTSEVLRNWTIVHRELRRRCRAAAAGVAVEPPHHERRRYRTDYAQDCVRQDRDALNRGIFPWRALQPAGVHGDLDGARRAKRCGQGGRDRISDLGLCRSRLRALDREHVLHPTRHAASAQGGDRLPGRAFSTI